MADTSQVEQLRTKEFASRRFRQARDACLRRFGSGSTRPVALAVFFFNDPATPEIYTLSYTLSLHDALPISTSSNSSCNLAAIFVHCLSLSSTQRSEEHTSELQSHSEISYAVFCLKKKK